MARRRGAEPGSELQTILFRKSAGWTVERAKDWAAEHGYRYGNADETDKQIHLRQFEPPPGATYRTIPFGRRTGIQGVVTWEALDIQEICDAAEDAAEAFDFDRARVAKW